jgi:hypothetical protein
LIALTKLRDLKLSGTAASRPDYVYSASGLVELAGELYLVADDEFHIAIFPKDPAKPGRWMRLFPGDLPLDYKQRKKEKADLEAITYLPPYKFAEWGALLVVPSLSRPNRIRGTLVLVSESGLADPIPIDYSALRSVLAPQIEELNIEGVALTGETIKFFRQTRQRNS